MSASLEQTLDAVARRVRLRPGEVIEKLLEEGSIGRDQLRPFATFEPLTEKRTFRLSPKTHARLQKLVEKHSIAQGGDGPDVSEVIRRVLIHAFKELGIWDGGEAPSGEEAEGPAARTVAAAAVAAPLWQTGGWAGKLAAVLYHFFIVFLPVLATWMPDGKPPKPPTPRD